jgi:hypothetical protein
VTLVGFDISMPYGRSREVLQSWYKVGFEGRAGPNLAREDG